MFENLTSTTEYESFFVLSSDSMGSSKNLENPIPGRFRKKFLARIPGQFWTFSLSFAKNLQLCVCSFRNFRESVEMRDRAVIIGGGLSGLATAAALAQRNVTVTLLETKSRLGGRAGAFWDDQSQSWVDHCQHVAMGCCTNFLHFCKLFGLEKHLYVEKTLNLIDAQNRLSKFSSCWLPAPLHLWPGFRKLPFLDSSDLKAFASGLKNLARNRDPKLSEIPFSRWLEEQKQPTQVIERFWKTILVSALSESLDRIDVLSARKVFVDGFLTHRKSWEIHIPRVSLAEFYGESIQNRLREQGVEIRFQSHVTRLVVENERVSRIELKNGGTVTGDHFVLAVPQHKAVDLLPDEARLGESFSQMTEWETAPISSVHLWFDRQIMEQTHAVFLERLCQWIFNRSMLKPSTFDVPESKKSYYYQIVISASRNLQEMTSEDVVRKVLAELSEVWPDVREAKLLHSRFITARKAVVSPLPGMEKKRPQQQTPIENLQVAGDWTKTGWPSTMESAVKSGYLAAENILGHWGRPEAVVQPELKPGFLSRLLFGL